MAKPKLFKSVADLQEKIDVYFKDCEGTMLRDKDGGVVLTKFGQPIIIGDRPPTMGGLALALGLPSRKALMTFRHKNKQWCALIDKAKQRVEAYAEERLYDKDGCNGARFTLQNNFGWDVKDDEAKASVHIICDIPRAEVKAEVPAEGGDSDGSSSG